MNAGVLVTSKASVKQFTYHQVSSFVIHCNSNGDQFSHCINLLVAEHTGWRLRAILRRRGPEKWLDTDPDEGDDFHLL